MLQIDLIATSSGSHHLLFGLNSNEISSFEIQIWITKYGRQAVDWLQSLSLGYISFLRGDLWVHNQPETLVNRVTFFNEKKDFIVGAVANENPNTVKVLDSLGVHTDGTWEVTSVLIPKTLNYPVGMKSRIPIGKFKRREGIWRAEFLRNMNTTSNTVDSVIDLLSGEELRAEAAYIIMKNTSNTQVKLYKIDVAMSTSKI